MAKVIVMTSGKGGVGKTTSSAAFATGLALRGFKTVVIDFDVGLRNLDLIMGCERRVVFDFVNVINGEAKLNQALIKDKRVDGLQVLATSQTRDKDALTREGVEQVLEELRKEFDYIICDSPAGIEHGAQTALYFADEAIVVTNPEVSSIRDSDRMVGILASKQASTGRLQLSRSSRGGQFDVDVEHRHLGPALDLDRHLLVINLDVFLDDLHDVLLQLRQEVRPRAGTAPLERQEDLQALFGGVRGARRRGAEQAQQHAAAPKRSLKNAHALLRHRRLKKPKPRKLPRSAATNRYSRC